MAASQSSHFLGSSIHKTPMVTPKKKKCMTKPRDRNGPLVDPLVQTFQLPNTYGKNKKVNDQAYSHHLREKFIDAYPAPI